MHLIGVIKNTILIAMYGQGHTRGRTAILKFPAATNQACAAITLNKYFHSDFILQDLIRRYDELRNLANDGGQKNLSGSLIKSLNVSYPKSIEQQKIADSLTSVDDKIGQLERKKAALEAYKKGMMQQLFSQQTRFKNDQDEGFPEWEVKKLGELGETYGGLTGKTKDDFGEGKPYIQYTQLYASSVISIDNCGLVEISPSERQNQVNSGDLFFTTSSETPNEIALSCVLLEEPKEVYLNSFCFGYRLKKPNKSFSKFLSYLLKTSTMRRKIIPLAQGSTRYNISKKELMKISIQVPHPSEQQKIADFLTALDCKIDLIAQELSQAQSFKKGLLQKMFV